MFSNEKWIHDTYTNTLGKHTANKFAVLDREMCQSKSYKNSTK